MKLSALQRLERLLIKAERDSKRACAQRGALPPGSSRARITSANAKWMRAAEDRDRKIAAYEAAGGDAAAILRQIEEA